MYSCQLINQSAQYNGSHSKVYIPRNPDDDFCFKFLDFTVRFIMNDVHLSAITSSLLPMIKKTIYSVENSPLMTIDVALNGIFPPDKNASE